MANFYRDNSDLKFQFNHPLMGKIVELKEDNFKDFGKYDYAPMTGLWRLLVRFVEMYLHLMLSR